MTTCVETEQGQCVDLPVTHDVLWHCRRQAHGRCPLLFTETKKRLCSSAEKPHRPSPEHLVQAVFEEGDGVQIELLKVVQPEELSGELADALLLLRRRAVGRHVDVREEEPAQIGHLAQVRSKLPQGRQFPGAIHFQILDGVQLYDVQDLPDVLHGHRENLQLLTAQVQQTLPLLDFLDEVGDGLVRGTFFEAKIYQHLHRSQGWLGPWPATIHFLLLPRGLGHLWLQQGVHTGPGPRPHSPEVLMSILP